MGRFSFAIDAILPALVLAPWVVNNPCPCHLSPVVSSVAFLPVFLFLSSLAVNLSTLFSPKNYDVTHVPATSSVYSAVCPWVPFLFLLFLALTTLFVLRLRYLQHATPNSHFKCFNPFYVTSLQCPCLASRQCYTPHKCFDYAFFQLEAEGSTHEIFLLIESFLCQGNVTSYFTFVSAVLGHHTSKIAELCDRLQFFTVDQVL